MMPFIDAPAGDPSHGNRRAAGPTDGTCVRRIVSLLPSATETICALGLRDRLVGVTHECD